MMPFGPSRIVLATRTVLLTAALAASGAWAQSSAVAVRGLAYDSVRARALADAFVTLDGARSTSTDGQGRFVIRDAPTGTRQLEVLGIGVTPVVMTVDVASGDTAVVTAQLVRVNALALVRVTASRRGRFRVEGFASRRLAAPGHMMDSTQIGPVGTMETIFRSLGMRVEGGGRYQVVARGYGARPCVAALWIDGLKSSYDELYPLRPSELAAVEVYAGGLDVPLEFSSADRASCGAVIVWTKWAFQ